MSDAAHMYDATHIEVLEGLEVVRKRPGMWVGSTGERGLHQMVFEVVGRAVNENVAGRAGSVAVALMPDGEVRVTDDGPGVPAEAVGEAVGPCLEDMLTRIHAQQDAGGRRAIAVSPLGNGLGLGVPNALASSLTAEVRRDGVRWVQVYARGVAVGPPTAAGPAVGSGITLAFRPDAGIFETVECSFDVLAERFRELAFLNRGLDISLSDERSAGECRSERFHSPGGARDFVLLLGEGRGTGALAQTDVIGFEREDPRMAGAVEVALQWRDSDEERVRTYANSRPTPEGGTHAQGFRDGVAAAVNAYARQRRLLTSADADLGADCIGKGLTAVVSVKLDQPGFRGATCAELDNTEARFCVEEAVREHLGMWLERHPEQAAAVIGRRRAGGGR
jgi:DNA gyrase subunit B